MKTYVIYPDKSIKEFDGWPESKEDIPINCYVFQPEDLVNPWVFIITDCGSVEIVVFKRLPDYCKAYALILPIN